MATLALCSLVDFISRLNYFVCIGEFQLWTHTFAFKFSYERDSILISSNKA